MKSLDMTGKKPGYDRKDKKKQTSRRIYDKTSSAVNLDATRVNDTFVIENRK